MSPKGSRQLLNERIESYILEQIRRGHYQQGDRLPPDRELAERFKSSQIPVRQATTRLCQRGYLKRVHGRGTYVRSVDPGSQRTGRLGILYWPRQTAFFASDFYARILSGIESGANEQRKSMLLRSLRRFEDDDPCDAIHELLDEVDGFILIDPLPHLLQAMEPTLRHCALPVVMVGYEGAPAYCDSIEIDSYRNSVAAVQLLIDHGHRRIACAYRPYADDLLHPNIANRLRAFEETMERNGLQATAQAMCLPASAHIDQRSGNMEFFPAAVRQESDRERFEYCLKENGRPSAIYAVTDGIAKQLYDRCHEAGLQIPDDISIVGHDDMSEARSLTPALTTVAVPLQDMGYQAVQRLVQVSDHHSKSGPPFRLSLSGEVKIRQSLRRVTS